ncbi:MAG: hypothetical protein RSA97_02280 [Oscillospiraceae bacterium]
MSYITADDYFVFSGERPQNFPALANRASAIVTAVCGCALAAGTSFLPQEQQTAVKNAVCAVVSWILDGGMDGFSAGAVGSVRFEKQNVVLPKEAIMYLASTGLLYSGM